MKLGNEYIAPNNENCTYTIINVSGNTLFFKVEYINGKNTGKYDCTIRKFHGFIQDGDLIPIIKRKRAHLPEELFTL